MATKSLTEGNHTIQVSLAGYDTLNATINVTATGVQCVSVVNGACGGSGLPRVVCSTPSGVRTVTVYLKEATGTSAKCTWINAQDHDKTWWISELIKAYFGRTDLGFTVQGHSAYISSAIKVYFGRSTVATEFGC